MDISNDHYRPNLLIICGSGRNKGKTLFGCRVIQWVKDTVPITAIKISMHKHEHGEGMELLEEGHGYTILRDVTRSNKDSGRFLAAGATTSLYIETTDDYLQEAFECSTKYTSPNSMIICESGRLSRHIKPALLVFIKDAEESISGIETIDGSQASLVFNSDLIFNNELKQCIYIKDFRWLPYSEDSHCM